MGAAGPPEGFCGAGSPCDHRCEEGLRPVLCTPPLGGASSPVPRVTFSPMRKSPKNLPEGPPLWVLPLGGIIIPPAARACMRLLLPPERVSTTEKDRFATLRFWANRSLFLPSFLQGKFFAVNPWLGRVLVARLGATFRAIRGIGEGRDETKLKRSHETKSVGGNLQNKSSRRLHDERQKSRFVSSWFHVRFKVRFIKKWLS